MLYPIAELLVGNIKRTLAVWAKDDHHRLVFTRSS
jgi:hypothetical protein